MKELFSTFTFGFLMAQVFPGAITVFSISLLFKSIDETRGLQSLLSSTIKLWFCSAGQVGILAFLSIAAGMLIHGLNWGVLGYLENYLERTKDGNLVSKDEKIVKFYTLKLEIILGPLIILRNILFFIFKGKDINQVTLQENVHSIHKDKMDAFNFIQDFYLYFSQFYLHTSFSLVVALICAPFIFFFLGVSLLEALGWILLLYIFCGVFFLIGRVQFASLFWAEVQLVKASKKLKGKSKN